MCLSVYYLDCWLSLLIVCCLPHWPRLLTGYPLCLPPALTPCSASLYESALSTLPSIPLLDICLSDHLFVLIKLQMDHNVTDPSLHTHWFIIVTTFPHPETWLWTKRTVIGCLTCQSNGLCLKSLDEDSRDEWCFVKNKTFLIEDSSSAQTILKVSHKCSASRWCETMPSLLQRSASTVH